MTPNFEDYNNEEKNSNWENAELDYFELLSAYIDNELSPQERDLVQQRLDSDPQIKQVYTQLLSLQHQIKHLSVPESEFSVETISSNVFARIERSQRRRKALLWGGGAIAAGLFALFSGIIPNGNSPQFKLAKPSSQDQFTELVTVAVAINKPTVNIPKTAVASPANQIIER